MAQYNKSLGRFSLTGIAPAPRGVPQIEVTFDIDANGIVKVSAKDMATNNEQKITITSSSNLSEEDIDRAVKEAEKYAEEDKKRKEEVDIRNAADQMVFESEKIISENGDKFSEDEKKSINDKIDALKEALKGQDINLIKERQDELQKDFYALSEKMYKAAQEAAGAQGAQGFDPSQAAGFGGQQGGQAPGADGYYEAPFTDVDE